MPLLINIDRAYISGSRVSDALARDGYKLFMKKSLKMIAVSFITLWGAISSLAQIFVTKPPTQPFSTSQKQEISEPQVPKLAYKQADLPQDPPSQNLFRVYATSGSSILQGSPNGTLTSVTSQTTPGIAIVAEPIIIPTISQTEFNKINSNYFKDIKKG